MPGFEEEAFQRAQRISRPRPQREKPEAPPEPQRIVPAVEQTEKNNSEKESKPQPARPKTGLIDALFADKEKSIILALMLLLGDESSDPSLLLALAYLLM